MTFGRKKFGRRLLVIPVVRDLFGELSITRELPGAERVRLPGSNPPITLSIRPERVAGEDSRNVYNFPFLLLDSGEPWPEANAYFIHLIEHKSVADRPTDDVRRRASILLDYLVFCEENGLDWLNFSGRRPAHRPTYRYYKHLIEKGKISNAVINQYTGVLYKFYTYVAKTWHTLDMERVDTTKAISLLLPSSTGTVKIDLTKRSQTRPAPGPSPVPMGYVRDDGEDLRPLNSSECAELLRVIAGPEWKVHERLIIKTALLSGARKQSVLTLRWKHIAAFSSQTPRHDGTYMISAGPGTSIDTKFDKPQTLYIPATFAEELVIYARSDNARRRRRRFKDRYAREFPDLPPISDEDMYLFISDQGGCYYMAKDDLRYPVVKSRPTGQVSEAMRQKILRFATSTFPKEFSFHWLRATYAYKLYQLLQPHVDAGSITYSNQITFIQRKLHHNHRETTEHYLKLFNNIDERLQGQEMYEDKLMADFADVLSLIEKPQELSQ